MYFRPPYYGKRHPNAGVSESQQKVEESGIEVEERGGMQNLHPVITENLEVRLSFIKKVYLIQAIQMLLMVAVASTVVFVPSVANFFVSTTVGFGLYIFSLILPFIVLCAMYFYDQYHPFNLLLLGVFTVAMSFAVGLTCAFTNGEIILEYLILTSTVVISITMYTFWVVKRGNNFFFQSLFREAAAVIIFMVFILIMIFFPLEIASLIIFGALTSLIFCVYKYMTP